MTEYALAPTSKFNADSPYRTPRVMLEQGLLRAYRVRANGTMRHLDLLPLDSTKRETAEWISDAVDMDGRSVESVARELHISTPTVRRFLESLALTEEIEAGEWDGLSFDSAGNPVWDTAWVESEVEAGELAGDDEETVVGAIVQGDPVAPKSAVRTRRTRPTQSVQDVVAKQGLPWPTEEERAAALAETVPGAQCEPVGTTADQVEEALAASVAQAKGAALPVCFCNDLGAHRPGGLPSCKNGAVVRKARSH
jgi:hypothetical protein